MNRLVLVALVLAMAALLGAAQTRSVARAPDTVASLRDLPGIDPSSTDLVLETLPLESGLAVGARLTRFGITSDRTRFVVGGSQGDRALAFDPASVQLWRGEVIGEAGSSVFVAATERWGMGSIDLGPGRARYAIQWGDPRDERTGPGEPRITKVSGFGGPMTVPVCGVNADGKAPPVRIPEGGAGPSSLQRIQVAIETDFEYFELFGDATEAAAYIVALYGAISDIYIRDVNARLELSFVRVWETEEDLYNDSNPFGPFRNHWNANMLAVERDVAQLLTGRRNLPYGGVASVSALCGTNGYSVCGYIIGSLVDPEAPHFGNWDIIVCAHELGHNCGTLHTHDYGLDNCAAGDLQRGTIMSYCHTTIGGNANIDLRFHTAIQSNIEAFIASALCLDDDCNANGIPDDQDIAAGSPDLNLNGVPDECEGCNANGVLDDADILAGSPDFNANGIPDECEPDCNNNGIPDDKDIADAISPDLNADGIPDECETDCNGNDLSDYTEIQANMSLDLDRDAVLDSCQDCNNNGVGDFEELAGGLNMWVASRTASFAREIHAASGVPVRDSVVGQIGRAEDLIMTPRGTFLVSDGLNHRVIEFDAITGAHLGSFISAGLDSPAGMTFRPGGSLLVADRGTDSVIEFDGSTGAPLGTLLASGVAGLIDPFGLAYGPNGNLFVTSADNRVLEFDGQTGAYLSEAANIGLDDPHGLLFKPNGNLLVASTGSGEVLEYIGGKYLGRFDRGGLASGFWQLGNPWTLRLGPWGRSVYVTSNTGNAAIHTYDLDTGLFRRSFYVLAQAVNSPSGFDFKPASANDCNMNLRPDACDIIDGTSQDVNGNGVPDECERPADLNGDGVVNVLDLLLMLGNWGPCLPPCEGDFNGDMVVNVLDLLIMLGDWG